MGSTVAHVEGSDTVPHRAYGYHARRDVRPDGPKCDERDAGDGGIYTNVDDMIPWDQALYGTDLVNEPDARARHDTAAAARRRVNRVRVRLVRRSLSGREALAPYGETSGFRNAIQRFPRRRLTVIVLTNRSSGEPGAIAERIADRLLFH